MPKYDYKAEHLLSEIFGENCGGKPLPCGCCDKCGCFCGLIDGTWELAIDDDGNMVYRPKK